MRKVIIGHDARGRAIKNGDLKRHVLLGGAPRTGKRSIGPEHINPEGL